LPHAALQSAAQPFALGLPSLADLEKKIAALEGAEAGRGRCTAGRCIAGYGTDGPAMILFQGN
jgi:hypothetical protein